MECDIDVLLRLMCVDWCVKMRSNCPAIIMMITKILRQPGEEINARDSVGRENVIIK